MAADVESRAGSTAAFAVFAAIFALSAILYSLGLGADSLGASEAYSAMAAAKPNVASIVQIPLDHDPGKQILYYTLLHFWSRVFGTSEGALRSLSVLFALVGLFLVFALGREMFDDGTGVAAAAIWAFNPVAMVFSHRARMYSMFIAIALGHLLALWRTRERPTAARAGTCGVLGATLLYTHMGGIIIVGTEAGLLMRDWLRGRRNPMAWLGLAGAIVLFLPWLPIARSQSQALVNGHWLDWIGPPQDYSIAIRAVVAAGAGAIALWILLARAREEDADEPLRWCAAWSLLPTIAFAAGSIVIRPMFHIRYVVPAAAVVAIAVAGVLGRIDARLRNLAAAAVAAALIILYPFDRPIVQPWRKIAEMVAGAGASEPVFFESGYVSSGAAARMPNPGFPFGYYSIPFDYYFHGSNPRITVPGFDPSSARNAIENGVAHAGGGWLISWKGENEAGEELPDRGQFRSAIELRGQRIIVYRILPIGKASGIS